MTLDTTTAPGTHGSVQQRDTDTAQVLLSLGSVLAEKAKEDARKHQRAHSPRGSGNSPCESPRLLWKRGEQASKKSLQFLCDSSRARERGWTSWLFSVT